MNYNWHNLNQLYFSWTKGQEVFEEHLLDADWSLNAANWQWLSASTFFHEYWRVYSPIEFGKKTDKNGDYIRKYLPVFKNFPTQYIFEPWMASPLVQKTAKCIIGADCNKHFSKKLIHFKLDYFIYNFIFEDPKPIVDHKLISKTNISRMKLAFEILRTSKTESAAKASASVSDKTSVITTVKKSKKNSAEDKKDENSDEERKPPKRKKAKITDHFQPK